MADGFGDASSAAATASGVTPSAPHSGSTSCGTNRGSAPDSTSPATTERWTLRGIATVPPGGTAASSDVATPSVEPAVR